MIDIFSTLAEKSYATEFFLVGGAFGAQSIIATIGLSYRGRNSATRLGIQAS